jgi:PAS domain S-box-containing protein
MKAASSKSFSARPLLVSIVYAVVSVVWIVFSDRLLRHLAASSDTMTRWSIIKGSLFVSLSAILMYFLMERISSANRNLAEKVKSQTAALQKSTDRGRQALETAREGVWAVDRQGRTELVNQRMGSMLGFRTEELVGRDLLEYVDSKWQKIAAERFRQQALSSDPVELKFRRKDGSEMWGSVYRVMLFDELGQYDGAVSRVSDISEQKSAEEQLRLQATALHAAANAIVITDTSGAILWVNPAFTTLTGYSSDEVIGMNPRILKSGEHDAAFYKSLWSTISEGKVWQGEMVNRHKSGGLYHEEMIIAPVRSTTGAVSHFIAIKQDVTTRNLAQDALRRSEKRFHRLVERSSDGIALVDAVGRIQYVSESACHISGHTRRELLGNNLLDFIDDEDRANAQRWFGCALSEPGSIIEGGFRMRRADGSWRYFEGTCSNRLQDPDVAALVVNFRDSTEHKSAVEALVRAEAKYREIFENAVVGICQSTPEGHFLSVNQAFATMFGFDSPEQAIQHTSEISLEMYADPAKREEFSHTLARDGVVRNFECEAKRRDGSRMCLLANARVVQGADGKIVYEGTVQDITEHKQAEEALRQSEEKFLRAFQSSPDAISISRLGDGRYVDVNEGYVRLFGRSREEAIGHTALELKVWENPEERRRMVTQLQREGSVRNLECSFRKKSDEIWRGLLSGEKIELAAEPCLLAVIRDVTEQTRLELQLRQAQRLEAVGRLAGGVAHDFNNMLGVILGYGDILQTQLPPRHPARASAAEMQKAALRAANLTRQLLAFSRKQILQPQVLNLNSLIEELCKMLRRLIGEDIEFVFRPGLEVARVKADPGQLEQVVMNLAVNARDAMPSGGQLLIETANVGVDADFAHRHAHMPPGPYVLLSVTDTGSGMTLETLSHIFEPFFTTKERGKGTGLGLSMVYGIVKRSGGYIWVDSEPNQGSAFQIYLPPTVEAEVAVPSLSHRSISLRGTETILIAEDDASVREMMRIVLAAAGYTVLEARDGAEALALLRHTRKSVHLLVTDIIMPGKMNGWELARSAAGKRPGIRALFMTGFGVELNTFGIDIAPDVMLLTKPFSADLLLRRIRETLDSGAGARSASTSP